MLKRGKLNKKIYILSIFVILIIVICLCIITNKNDTIDLKYCKMKLSHKHSKYLHLEEIREIDFTVNEFSMNLDKNRIGLFQIIFGNEQIGDTIGYINTGEDYVPVSIIVSNFNENDFETRENYELYIYMMELLQDTLKSITSCEEFIQDIRNNVTHVTKKQIMYWIVELPEDIELKEEKINDTDIVQITCNINKRDISLYEVYVGSEITETILGTYTVDEERKIVSVGCTELPEMDSWNQEDREKVYTYMETINDVIQVITESENFSPEQ